MSRDYNEDNIVHLEGLDAIKHRPGMYIGGTGSNGLHHMILEIVSNSIDEASNGFGDVINVTITKDGALSVEDFGRGMPLGMHKKYNKPALEMLMMYMHTGGKMDADTSYKYSAGLHGLGTKIVNALSEKTEITVFRDGKIHKQIFSRGEKVTDLQVVGTCGKRTGTIVSFKPDKNIFETVEWNYSHIRSILKKMAYLNSHITINLTDERPAKPKTESLHFDNGVVGMALEMAGDSQLVISKPIRITGKAPVILDSGKKSEYEVEVVILYVDNRNENVVSFVNTAPTMEAGTHVQGFRTALTKSLNDAARSLDKLKAKDNNLTGNEIREGLIAVVNAKVPDPKFQDQIKSKLVNTEVAGLTSSIVTEQLKNYLEDNPKEAIKIIDRICMTRRVNEALRKTRESLLGKKDNSLLSRVESNGKVSPASGRDPELNELFIVEGSPSNCLR